ncbi:aminotransferase class IV family protein [Nocardia sp. NPDC004722]
MSISNTYLNGEPATIDDLAPLAFAGFAHFTAMQVRNRAVRGLDLHLDRLRNASDELFGRHLPDERILELLSAAVESAPDDVSLTAFLSSRPGEFARADAEVGIDVLVKVTDPASPSTLPLTLDVVPHQRHLAHLKHVGEVAKTQYLRQANARGYDDAVFTDAAGRLSEATIWNIAFWDGRSVIWPEADVLSGTTMQILQRRLAKRGIDQVTRPITVADLHGDLGGVVTNSWIPGIAVARIGEQSLGRSEELVKLLHDTYESEPPIALA